MSAQAVLDYIHANWSRSVYRDSPGTGFGGVDLPHPYTSPCIKGEGHFHFFFYWDTYFTNLGLLRSGLADVARDNIRNMLWLIDRHGFMPNHVGLENRSQPPYLARMVRDYVAATGDRAFLREAAPRLRQEYHFWTTARRRPLGLEGHGHQASSAEAAKFYDQTLPGRLGLSADVSFAEKARVGGHHLAEAETGWDFNPRFDRRCLDHVAVDLAALLHDYETLFLEIGPELGWDDAELWRTRAQRRRDLVGRHLWCDERGWFLDYDCAHERRGPVRSLAGLLPLFTGLATPGQAARIAAGLSDFEREHGIAVTPATDAGARGYQWAYPNVWPPLVYVTVEGLRRYGHVAHARRIAEKFVATTVRLHARTGRLWEKTNAETGEVAGGEYQAAAMLGWTAGVFIALHAWLNGKEPDAPRTGSARA